MFQHAISIARERIWISSPYFVPDDAILSSLILAARRGVDVRILLPQRPDHKLVWLASFTYVPDLLRNGVRVFRYGGGFLHQKAFILDRAFSMIGTANLDNRSLRLNFEISLMVKSRSINSELAQQFERDFADSTEEDVSSAAERSTLQIILSRFARLFAPILRSSWGHSGITAFEVPLEDIQVELR